jgi:hypothetical protein
VADTVGHREGTSTYADAYSGILSERPPIIPAYRLVFVWVHNHVCVATHQPRCSHPRTRELAACQKQKRNGVVSQNTVSHKSSG